MGMHKAGIHTLGILGLAFFLILSGLAAFAEPQKMFAKDAYSASLRQDLIILDIRSPGEWAETGVAEGAWPVTMHDPKFGTNLQRIFEKYPNTPVALICATGGRSNHVATVLEKNGVRDVADISEGMFGNGTAPGWIALKLPIVDVETAQSNLTKSLLK